jgi:non-canonical poly(A) RNA polymerase PAPD5/7
LKQPFKASVPLLRLTDIVTGIQVDLTFEKKHSLAANTVAQEWEIKLDAKYGEEIFQALVLVTRKLLEMRRLVTT